MGAYATESGHAAWSVPRSPARSEQAARLRSPPRGAMCSASFGEASPKPSGGFDDWPDPRTISNPREAGRRRNGRGVSRDGHSAEARCRPEDPPSELALDPERLARFDREAQALAALNHPHIAQVYGFAHEGDVRAIVMELVEGPTLAERIARGLLCRSTRRSRSPCSSPRRSIRARARHRPPRSEARQHQADPDGAVKVLDFGLAKVLAGDATDPRKRIHSATRRR